MPDRRVVLIGGSIETEDDDPGLGERRVGGHRGRAQVWEPRNDGHGAQNLCEVSTYHQGSTSSDQGVCRPSVRTPSMASPKDSLRVPQEWSVWAANISVWKRALVCPQQRSLGFAGGVPRVTGRMPTGRQAIGACRVRETAITESPCQDTLVDDDGQHVLPRESCKWWKNSKIRPNNPPQWRQQQHPQVDADQEEVIGAPRPRHVGHLSTAPQATPALCSHPNPHISEPKPGCPQT